MENIIITAESRLIDICMQIVKKEKHIDWCRDMITQINAFNLLDVDSCSNMNRLSKKIISLKKETVALHARMGMLME